MDGNSKKYKKMNRKNLIIIALLLVSLVSVKAQEIIAQWPMGDTPGQQVISDTQKKFNLTQYVAFTNGCYSGWAQSYWKTFDEWNSPWSLEGVFKTNGGKQCYGTCRYPVKKIGLFWLGCNHATKWSNAFLCI